MDPGPATLRTTPASVAAVEIAGIKKLKIYHMANTRKIKRGDLLPWFLEDHAALPAWYLEDCQKFFEWLKRDNKYRKTLH